MLGMPPWALKHAGRTISEEYTKDVKANQRKSQECERENGDVHCVDGIKQSVNCALETMDTCHAQPIPCMAHVHCKTTWKTNNVKERFICYAAGIKSEIHKTATLEEGTWQLSVQFVDWYVEFMDCAGNAWNVAQCTRLWPNSQGSPLAYNRHTGDKKMGEYEWVSD